MDITDEMRRHSAAHLVARAVCNLYPGTQTDIGPATDDGFYYDFDLEHRLTPEDFPAIEKEVARLIALDEPFKGLDEANRRAAMETVRALAHDKTVLFVTHDAAEAEFFGGNRLSVP